MLYDVGNVLNFVLHISKCYLSTITRGKESTSVPVGQTNLTKYFSLVRPHMPSGDVVVSSALKNVYAKITYIVYFYVNKYICIILIKIRCSN